MNYFPYSPQFNIPPPPSYSYGAYQPWGFTPITPVPFWMQAYNPTLYPPPAIVDEPAPTVAAPQGIQREIIKITHLFIKYMISYFCVRKPVCGNSSSSSCDCGRASCEGPRFNRTHQYILKCLDLKSCAPGKKGAKSPKKKGLPKESRATAEEIGNAMLAFVNAEFEPAELLDPDIAWRGNPAMNRCADKYARGHSTICHDYYNTIIKPVSCMC
jgi:hypothetical protein